MYFWRTGCGLKYRRMCDGDTHKAAERNTEGSIGGNCPAPSGSPYPAAASVYLAGRTVPRRRAMREAGFDPAHEIAHDADHLRCGSSASRTLSAPLGTDRAPGLEFGAALGFRKQAEAIMRSERQSREVGDSHRGCQRQSLHSRRPAGARSSRRRRFPGTILRAERPPAMETLGWLSENWLRQRVRLAAYEPTAPDIACPRCASDRYCAKPACPFPTIFSASQVSVCT